jgi:hypothetical protein
MDPKALISIEKSLGAATLLLGPNDTAGAPFNRFIAVGLALRMQLERARMFPAPSEPSKCRLD